VCRAAGSRPDAERAQQRARQGRVEIVTDPNPPSIGAEARPSSIGCHRHEADHWFAGLGDHDLLPVDGLVDEP
jgi:hypothetical protein